MTDESVAEKLNKLNKLNKLVEKDKDELINSTQKLEVINPFGG
ncbi:MAG: hypothetical protein PHW87_00200 [Methanothrix sp.]|nr:hypothetical protein [Methanothrix sp.]